MHAKGEGEFARHARDSRDNNVFAWMARKLLRLGRRSRRTAAMDQSQRNELMNCLACGAEISLSIGPAYAVTDTSGLCFRCATARGGSYDEAEGTWSRAPAVAGVPATDV
jgi:hypothetical protein